MLGCVVICTDAKREQQKRRGYPRYAGAAGIGWRHSLATTSVLTARYHAFRCTAGKRVRNVALPEKWAV